MYSEEKHGFATSCQYNIEGIHYLYISMCTSMTRAVSEILTCGELVGAGETKTSIGFNVNAKVGFSSTHMIPTCEELA